MPQPEDGFTKAETCSCNVLLIHYIFIFFIYLLTAIWLTVGGSSTVNIYTQIIYRTTQLTTLVGIYNKVVLDYKFIRFINF
jgi:hypothetical protein